jgi:hypothetical protein
LAQVLGDTGLPSFLPIVLKSIAVLRNPDLAEMLHPRKRGLSFTAVLLEHIEMPDPLSAPSWNTTEPPRSAQKAPYNLARWTAQ